MRSGSNFLRVLSNQIRVPCAGRILLKTPRSSTKCRRVLRELKAETVQIASLAGTWNFDCLEMRANAITNCNTPTIICSLVRKFDNSYRHYNRQGKPQVLCLHLPIPSWHASGRLHRLIRPRPRRPGQFRGSCGGE
jgi:hypothetical protein